MFLKYILIEGLWSNDGDILVVCHLVIVRINQHVMASKLSDTRAQVRQIGLLKLCGAAGPRRAYSIHNVR
jgi:hypothetical protein